MSVEPFDPGALTLTLSEEVLGELLAAAADLDAPGFGLEKPRIAALAGIARHESRCDWAAAAESLASEELVALIHLFTVAESLPGWEAGARSPVILLAAELKKRGEYPLPLTAWIKSHTDNRFLPYGSLLDRL